jgi:hypothetical protein
MARKTPQGVTAPNELFSGQLDGGLHAEKSRLPYLPPIALVGVSKKRERPFIFLNQSRVASASVGG